MSDFEHKVAIGTQAFQSGQLGLAIDAFESALAINDESAEVHQNLAGALCQNGDLERGLKHFARAVELAPHDAEIQRNYGYAFKLAGNLDAAIEHYHKCLALDPDNVVARVNLANAFFDAGQKEDAREQCDIVVAGGINETAMLHAADLLKKIGPKDPPAGPYSQRAVDLAGAMLDKTEQGNAAIMKGVQDDPSPEFLVLCALAMSEIPTAYNTVVEHRERAWNALKTSHHLATTVALDPITPLPTSPPENVNAIVATVVQECLTSALNRAAPSAYGTDAIDLTITNLEELEAELADTEITRKAPSLRALFEKKSSGCMSVLLFAAAIPTFLTILNAT